MSINNNTEGTFEVGYGRPPKRSQFQPGQSGNPKGRPKGVPNISAVLSKAVNERVVVTENGGRKTISKLEAAVKQIANKAAGGDARVAKLLLQLLKDFGEPATSSPAVIVISGADAKL